MGNFSNIDLFSALDLDDLPEEKKKELVEKMTELVERRLMVRVLGFLSDKEKEELDALLEKNEGVHEFLKARIPNLEALTLETVENLKEDLVGLKTALLEKKAP